MSRLDDYQTALLAAYPEVSGEALIRILDSAGSQFTAFIVDHGLGPQWHERTGRAEFHPSRLAAEAFYLAQEHALRDVDAALQRAGVEYALIKGAANRLLLYANPAIRACHDLDLLVKPQQRLRAATAIVETGFDANPQARSVSRELLLTRGNVCVDLHWSLLREGRLRRDFTATMLSRRRRSGALWILNNDDAVFALLVHPAFTKHLAGWDMGLHRVMDIAVWMRSQDFDWPAVRTRLEQNGVQTAAWATLRWIELLAGLHALPRMAEMAADVRPGRLREVWLATWLRKNLSARTSGMHWARLLGFTMLLHDTAGDSVRALAGRCRARLRNAADLAIFRQLGGQ